MRPRSTAVELIDLRTASSKTFQNPDGTRTWVASTGNVHYADPRGRWQDIDVGITPFAGPVFGYAMTRNAYQSFFAGRADQSPAARFQTGGWAVDFSAADARPGPVVVRGNQITYRDALPHADLRFTTNADELREEIILHAWPGAGAWEFDLNLEGVRIVEGREGTLDFVDAQTGARTWFMPRPYMVDAAGERSWAVSKRLMHRDGRTLLRVQADEAWLKAAGRKYPVIVDPTWTQQPAQQDSFISNKTGQLDSNFGSGQLWVNRTATGANGVRRSFVSFDMTAAPAPSRVVDSTDSVKLTLIAYQRYVDSGYPSLEPGAIEMHFVNANWSQSTLTWNNAPAFDSTVLYSLDRAGSTGLYRFFYNGRTKGLPVTSRGYLFKPAVEVTGTGYAGMLFYSNEYYNAVDSNRPKLEVDYLPDCAALSAPVALSPENVTSCSAKWVWGRGANTCEEGYKIYDAATGGNLLYKINMAGGVTYWHESDLSAATSYTRYVAAYWADQESPRTALGPITTPSLDAPTANSPLLTSSSIQWRWNDLSLCETAYRIYDAATDGSLLASLSPGATVYTETNLPYNTLFNRWVTAVQGATESPRVRLGPATTLPLPQCFPNGIFQDGFINGVGQSWRTFVVSGTPVYSPSTVGYGDNAAQQIYLRSSSFGGGIYQFMAATPGTPISVSVWAKVNNAIDLTAAMVVDPTGGTDVYRSGNIWRRTASTAYTQLSADVTPSGTRGRITLFLFATSSSADVDGSSFFDGVSPTGCPANPEPPAIADQPVSQSVASGTDVTFTVSATGSAPLQYQWQKNQVNITSGGPYTDVTTQTLKISNATQSENGLYRCVVTNTQGSATSNEATLVVGPPVAPGDFDLDGDVDLVDFAVLQDCLGVENPTSACAAADLSRNSLVDYGDVVLFARCMSGDHVSADLNCLNP